MRSLGRFSIFIVAGILSSQLFAQHSVHNDTFNNTSGCAANNAASVGSTSCGAVFPGATDVCSPAPGNSPNCNTGANTVMFDLAPTNLADFTDDNVDIHSLVYPGYTGPVFANVLLWHGPKPVNIFNFTPKIPGPENLYNGHLLNGYTSDSDAQVDAQFRYMQRLKIDGIVANPPGPLPLTLTGQNAPNHDVNETMEKWKTKANGPGSTFLYSVMSDQVMWNQNCPGVQDANKQFSTLPACVEQIMICSLDYMNTPTSSQFTCAFDGGLYSGGGFFADTHYWKLNNGHPVMSYFFDKTEYFDPVVSNANLCTAAAPCAVYNDNQPGTTCIGHDDCWNKIFAGIEHHISNTSLFAAASKPFIIHRDNFSAFDANTLPNNGSFRWFHATGDQTFEDVPNYTTWLQQGLSAIQANPSNPPVVLASGYGKVDFAQAGFHSNLVVMDARCGQTFLDIMKLPHDVGFGPSPQTPLPAIEIVTWDDYDEGTEMETGIDNCLNPIQSSLNGSTFMWSISFNSASGSELRTIDHYTIYNTNDGSTNTGIDHNLVKIADVAVNTANSGSYSFTLPSGLPNPTLIYVKAVAKPMLTNHLSAGVAFAPAPPAPGTGSITFSGDPVPMDGTFGYIDLSVNNVLSCEVVFQEGDLPWDVANRMATAINGGCTSFITARVDPNLRGASSVPMNMTAKTTGSGTNYPFSISYRPGDPQWFTLTPSGATLTGGHN